MSLDIRELEIDDANEAEFGRHGISVSEMIQLLESEIRVFRNKKHRAGSLLMIGTTRGGRVLTVPITRTAVAGRWRPITAWDSSAGERTRYAQ